MIYGICFVLSIFILVGLFAYGNTISNTVTVFSMTIVVGNGGYLALAYSENIKEAILANILCYVIGIFSPMLMFLIICEICRIHIPRWTKIGMFLVQIVLYFCVCTIGKNGLFYDSILFHVGKGTSYITKEYGPMHIGYLLTMYAYVIGSIVVVLYSMRKRSNSVSTANTNRLLLSFIFTVLTYIGERFTNVRFELMPILFPVVNLVAVAILVKQHRYSAYGNPAFMQDKLKNIGYIVFNKKLMYMGCNDYAGKLFPELYTWELEKKIPGNGGRFNTFLRQPFMRFVKEDWEEEKYYNFFEFKGMDYRIEISKLKTDKGKIKGYIIEVAEDVRKSMNRKISEE